MSHDTGTEQCNAFKELSLEFFKLNFSKEI